MELAVQKDKSLALLKESSFNKKLKVGDKRDRVLAAQSDQF